MKKLFVLAVIALFVSEPALAATDKDKHPYKEIDAAALVEMKKDKSVIVVDARGGKYFDGEVIEGAVNLSVQDTSSDSLAKIIPSKDTKVVFYCTNTSCQASALSAHKAADAGYKEIYKYPGGIEDWKVKGLPVAKIN